MKRAELAFIAIKPPLDYIAVVCAAVVAYSLRYFSLVQEIRPVIFNLPLTEFLGLSSVVALLWVVIFAITGLYSITGTKTIRHELAKVFVACSAGLALVLAVMVFSRFLFDSRFIILASWALAIVFVSVERLVIKFVQKLSYRAGVGVHRVALVGSGHIADELKKEFSKKIGLGYRVVYEFSEFNNATLEQLKTLVAEDKIDEVLQVNPSQNAASSAELVQFVNEYHLDYRYTADLLGTQLTNLEVVTFAGTPIVEVKKTRLDGWGTIYKRIFDIIISLLLIKLLFIVMVIIAILVKLTSNGPTFFSYKRIGQFGKPFRYFKFRSMVKDAHQKRFDPEFIKQQEDMRHGTPIMKFKNDPRITPFGKFIRRWSLDELPELFLVLIGRMSLVGPRPHEVEEVDRYQRHHKRVLTIKPGITGLAQVSGRSDLNFEDEVKLDTYYIENWSLGMDLYILFKTPLAIMKRRLTT